MTRVLVTGGRGFLGQHLVELLLTEGVYPAAAGSEWDLTDPHMTHRLFATTQPDLVFHLAAEVGGIGANQANPARYWYANLLMGAHVLEQSRRFGVRKLVMVGTACSYPRDTPVPFREQDLWNGYPEETNAPYGIAKRTLIVGAEAYRSQYGLNAITLVPANLYGPGDNFRLDTSHVIPALIRKMVDAAREGRAEVKLWGDGSASREFLHVKDAAEGLWLAAERYDDPQPVNLAGGGEIRIRDLAAMIAKLTGYEGQILWDHDRPNGQPRRRLDPSRAHHAFGFLASTGLDEGLAETIAWYRKTVDCPAR